MSLQTPIGFAIHLKAADVVRLLSIRRLVCMGLHCPNAWAGGLFGIPVASRAVEGASWPAR